MTDASVDSPYFGMPVLVTGGEGFLGSNLAIRLAQLGAAVVVVDARVPGCGANPANLEGWLDRIEVVHANVSQTGLFASQLAAARVIFNLAGEISHTGSMTNPVRDLTLNVIEQLHFLDACSKLNPGVRVVYAGTRQVYGRPLYLPVDENHPTAPIDFNGVHKYAAEQYHLMLSRLELLDARVLRLTNVYGPRLALNVCGQGVLGAFFRHALLGFPLPVYGKGDQLRDPLYVDDAIDAFLLTGLAAKDVPRVLQLAGTQALSLLEMAHTLAALAPESKVVMQEFPPGFEAIHVGSYYGICERIARHLGWRPSVGFAEGARRTLDFFRTRQAQYLPYSSAPAGSPLHDERSRV